MRLELIGIVLIHWRSTWRVGMHAHRSLVLLGLLHLLVALFYLRESNLLIDLLLKFVLSVGHLLVTESGIVLLPQHQVGSMGIKILPMRSRGLRSHLVCILSVLHRVVRGVHDQLRTEVLRTVLILPIGILDC